LEKGFLGKDGFEATVDQIWAMGKKLDEAFQGLGRTDVADWIYDQTVELVKLAEKRDELAKKLKDAEQNLNQLIQERDKFSAALRSSAIKFAAAMKVEYDSVKTFEQVSDRGFFIESEEKKAKNLVDTLQERADALKRYYENIKKLRDSGLDSNLLKDLLTAGPEASGETAAALVEGGQEMIDSVNVIYKDIEQTADLIGEFGADEFHQAGVDQAQALVDGLTDDLEAITEQAELITDEIYKVVEPFAKEMQEQGAKASKGMAKGISSGIPAIAGSMGGVSGAVKGGFAQMDDDATRGASKMLDTFRIEFKEPMIQDLVDWSNDAIAEIDKFVLDANESLEGLKLPTSLNFNPSNWLKVSWTDFKAASRRFWDGFKRAFRAPLDALATGARYLIPGLDGLLGWLHSTSGSGGHGVYPDTITGMTRGIGAGINGAAAYYGGSVPTNVFEPVVKVYIGDQELRGIVRTEVVYNDRREASRVVTGRRV
jgi:uncharacterized phage infection (PIP) family protein YhgE